MIRKRAKIHGKSGRRQPSSTDDSKKQFNFIASLETMQMYEYQVQKRFLEPKVYTEKESKGVHYNFAI